MSERARGVGRARIGAALRAASRRLVDPGPADRRATLALGLAATVAGVVIGWRFLPATAFDDAAITFRYAERIAGGLGFTYNDGDATNGASAPLYTLLLAVAARAGVAPPDAAAVIGVASLGAAAGLVAVVAARVAGVVAGVAASLWLVTSDELRNVALSGMESALATVLGLGAVLALSLRRPVWAGALAGLALVNRLDGLAVVVAVVGCTALYDRRAALRTAVVAGATALPWFVFSTAYFGSPVPFSGTQKVMSRAGTWDHDPTWVARALLGRHGTVAVVLAVGAVAVAVGLLARGRRTRAATLLAVLVWSGLHAAAYSVIDLGAPYPWYTTVAYVGVAVGSGTTLAVGVATARAADGAALSELPAAVLERKRIPVAVVALVGLALVVSVAPGARYTAEGVLDPPAERTTRLLDATRRDAGRYVQRHARGGDVVRTCFGWVAYEARDLDVDEVCPLNTRRAVDPPTWWVESPGPEEPEPTAPRDAVEAATFERRSPDGVTVRSTVYVDRRRANTGRR